MWDPEIRDVGGHDDRNEATMLLIATPVSYKAVCGVFRLTDPESGDWHGHRTRAPRDDDGFAVTTPPSSLSSIHG